MKILYYFISVAILVSASCFSASAQNDSNFLKYSLKINVFQWGMNEPNIGFEYRFSPKIGWENTIGTYGIFNRDFHTGPDVMEPLPHKGITFRSNFKWYYTAKNKYNKDDGYISPMLLFKNNVASGSFGHYNDITVKTENRTIAGLSLLIGHQFVRRHFILDLYGGGGVRYRYIHGTVRSSYTSWGGSGGPPGYYPYKFSYDEWQPSIHLGVKLGYDFRGTPQNMNRKFESPYLKHSLTTHLISSSLREQNIVYEYRINRELGLEASAGGHLFKYKKIYHELSKDLLLTQSYLFSFQPKLYLGSPKDKRYTYYVAPMVMYRNEKYNRIGDSYYRLHDRKIGPSFSGGCQINEKRFVLNFYLGIGLHKHYFTRQMQTINEIEVDDYTRWKLAIHGGIKLGYGFKQIQ